VPPENLIAAYIPLFVGGAALTRKFTATRLAAEYGGATLYAKDAMEGLDLANQLFSPLTRDAELTPARPAAPAAAPGSRVPKVKPPRPPDLDVHVLRDVPLAHVYPYQNLQMLYGKHREATTHGLLRAHGLYQWFGARAAGDTLHVLAPDAAEAARFRFPRQRDGEQLCLTDYVHDDADDWVALFAVTCGEGVRERAQAWEERGDYLRSHALQVLAIECAEAFAEMLHARLRTLWGFPDPPELSIDDKPTRSVLTPRAGPNSIDSLATGGREAALASRPLQRALVGYLLITTGADVVEFPAVSVATTVIVC